MKPWANIVMLAVPRGTLAANTIRAFLQHAKDIAKYRVRWILHIDCPPGMDAADTIAEYEAGLRQATSLVGSFHITWSKGFGQPKAYHQLLKNTLQILGSKERFFYLEDDKLPLRPFFLDDLLNRPGEHVSLQGFSGRPGNTSASVWATAVLPTLLQNWPETGVQGNLEDYLKEQFSKNNWQAGIPADIVEDIGLPALAALGWLRVRGSDGNPLYIKAPARVVYYTYIDENVSNDVFRVCKQSWDWRMTMSAFDLRIYRAPAFTFEKAEQDMRTRFPDKTIIHIAPVLQATKKTCKALDYEKLFALNRQPKAPKLGFKTLGTYRHPLFQVTKPGN